SGTLDRLTRPSRARRSVGERGDLLFVLGLADRAGLALGVEGLELRRGLLSLTRDRVLLLRVGLLALLLHRLHLALELREIGLLPALEVAVRDLAERPRRRERGGRAERTAPNRH